MSVRTILEAAQEAGYGAPRPDQWVALVVLVEQESGGRPAAVAEHFDRAKRYPGWPVGDHARYGPRIALRTPLVLAELGRLGIEAAGEAASSAVGEIAEPIVEVARLPVRVLQWLTDPGTVTRVAKVVIGGGLILGGAYLLARPAVQTAGRQAVRAAGSAIGASPQGRVGRTAAKAAAAKSGG